MEVVNIKNVLDYETIIRFYSSCSVSDDNELEFFYFNGNKKFTISEHDDGINLSCDDGRTLNISWRDGIKCTCESGEAPLQVVTNINSSDYTESIETIKNNSSVELVISESMKDALNEGCDSSTLTSSDFCNEVLDFSTDGVSYRDYYFLNDGGVLHCGNPVDIDKIDEVDSSLNKNLLSELLKVIKFRINILLGNTQDYVFTKQEMSMFYMILCQVMFNRKNAQQGKK